MRNRSFRTMRCPYLKAALAVALGAGPITAVSAPPTPDALVCPAQTRYRRIELKEQGVYVENCRDERGLRQGPYRFRRLSDDSIEAQGTYVDNRQNGPETLYDTQGKLLSTTPFVGGAAGEVKYTRTGLAAVAKEANEYAKRSGKQVLVYPSGDAGLTFEHTTDAPPPGHVSPEATRRFRQAFTPLICGLLVRQAGLRSIDLRIFWRDGQLASVEKFRLSQCRSSTSPAATSTPAP